MEKKRKGHVKNKLNAVLPMNTHRPYQLCLVSRLDPNNGRHAGPVQSKRTGVEPCSIRTNVRRTLFNPKKRAPHLVLKIRINGRQPHRNRIDGRQVPLDLKKWTCPVPSKWTHGECRSILMDRLRVWSDQSAWNWTLFYLMFILAQYFCKIVF